MAKRIFILSIALVAFCSVRLAAQVSYSPIFPAADDNVTLTFNANEGTAGLANFTGNVYAHIGVVLAGANSATWTNVVGTWGTDEPRTKMTAIGGGLYTLSFNVRTFFGVAAGVPIYKIACVFRNVDGTKEGKGPGGSDMYYDIIQPGAALQTRIVTPAVSGCQLVQNGATISVKGAASQNSTLTLTDNGVQIATATNAKELTKDIVASGTGTRTVVFKAVNGTAIDSQSFVYVVPAATQNVALPAGMELGANVNARGDSVTFVMHAPNKNTVFVVGSFNNYTTDKAYQMNRADSATWWLKVGGFTPNQIYTYQYSVDCAVRVADALSTLVLDPNNDSRIPASTYPNPIPYPTGKTTGFVSVIQPGKPAYNWRVPNFVRPEKTNLVIYELLMRDFVAKHDFQTLIDTIQYLKKLNVNAIELMPVNEYSNNESWGYNPTFHNALDKYYGTPDKFKEFVDVCHQNGIAVIIDVVFNHIDNGTLSALYPLNNNPWLNATAPHPYSVFIDMNHESPLTKAYVNRSLKYWLQEYRIDGYRFDLTKGFTQKVSNENTAGNYDQSRIDNLKVYHQTVQQTSAGAYTILEHFCDNREETVLANEGMMLWREMNYNANQATMGYGDNAFRRFSAKSNGWDAATNNDKLISFAESHDKERLMFKNLAYGNTSGGYSVKDLATALRRQEAATVLMYAIPGPKMLWQFGELGYEIKIDSFGGRTSNKPIRWEYLTDPNRKRLYTVTSNMIGLKTSQPLFRTTTYDLNELGDGLTKVFHLNSTDLSATIVQNYNVTAATVSANFPKAEKWYDYLSGDSITVTDLAAARTYLPGEYHVYLDKRITPPSGFVSGRVGTAEFTAQATDFQVYPTPSVSGRFFVGYALKNGGEVQYDVFNLQGQRVVNSTKKTVAAGTYQEEMTTPLSAGVYFVRLSVNGATATQKLIVQ